MWNPEWESNHCLVGGPGGYHGKRLPGMRPVQPSSQLRVMQRLSLSPETLLAWRLIGITKSIRVAAKGHNLRLISLLGRLIKCYQLMALVKGDTCSPLS